jgi:hypothetical protein
VLCLPITHDKSLKIELVLQEVIEGVRVLAPIRVVDLIVGAHYGTSAGFDGIGKWPDPVRQRLHEDGEVILPQIHLVHGLVINIGTNTLGNVETITLSLASLAESLLFIGDEMLCACNNSSILNTSNGGINQGTSQIWIGTESFLRNLLDIFKALFLQLTQFLPPSAILPKGPQTGPSCTSTPLPRCSIPIASPRA